MKPQLPSSAQILDERKETIGTSVEDAVPIVGDSYAGAIPSSLCSFAARTDGDLRRADHPVDADRSSPEPLPQSSSWPSGCGLATNSPRPDMSASASRTARPAADRSAAYGRGSKRAWLVGHGVVLRYRGRAVCPTSSFRTSTSAALRARSRPRAADIHRAYSLVLMTAFLVSSSVVLRWGEKGHRGRR